MAGDWIKVENVTPNKPEVFQIAEIMDITPDDALGKLIRLWVWADEQTYDGNASVTTRALVDRVAGATGFANALIDAGWLVVESGGLVFPNFLRHNGQSAKTRALTAKRVQAHRARKTNDVGVTQALPEKRRVKRRVYPPLSPQGETGETTPTEFCFPQEIDTDDFHDAWSEWESHRAEIHKDLTPTSAKVQLDKLAKMGEQRAIAAIRHSIGQSYVGIVEPTQISGVKKKFTTRGMDLGGVT